MVDAANVVGSVPDGWWRDRPGAAARLHADLVARLARRGGGPGDFPYDDVVLVLEGQARSGVPVGDTAVGDTAVGRDGGVVRTVHAVGSGDDAIVATCRALGDVAASVTLASADRGLVARVRALGAAVVGPRSVRQVPAPVPPRPRAPRDAES